MEYSVAEAKNHLPKLIQAVERGEPVTITRHGHPVVDIVPTQAEKRKAPKFGTLKGKVKVLDPHCFDPMTSEEASRFLEGRF